MPLTVSPREEVQDRLTEFLGQHQDVFNAPYGILTGMVPTRRGGKARQITFGCAATLDATITIYSPTYLLLACQGPMRKRLGLTSTFSNPDRLVEWIKEAMHL